MEFKTSSDYRRQARMVMSGKYWYMFGVSLLAMITIGIGSGISELFASYGNGVNEPTMLSTLVSFACILFINFPISVGLLRFFIISTRTEADVSELIYPYKNKCTNVIIAMLKRDVFVMLWSLLFIIPGVIKSYSYFMVGYLLAENPNMESSRAFEISKQAMEGYKMKVFSLNLSFMGWILLGLCAFGVGIVFVIPYEQTALVGLYEDIKQSAISRGIMSQEELTVQNVI